MDFGEYVATRGPALERFAYVLTGDPHLAQDLVQTALLEAYRRWRWVARADHPDADGRRIVTTSYVDWRRRRSSAEAPSGALPDPAGPDLAADPLDLGGAPGPSYVDLPAPGCWELTLRWGTCTDTVRLAYAPRS